MFLPHRFSYMRLLVQVFLLCAGTRIGGGGGAASPVTMSKSCAGFPFPICLGLLPPCLDPNEFDIEEFRIRESVTGELVLSQPRPDFVAIDTPFPVDATKRPSAVWLEFATR
ncbi:hypothetical protein HanPSC8_Chr04g0152421 [Helianthus annuus]|nr:hypothetical protein HanPSC8_Chr04g0152421 [Helianthus annuus]